MRGLAMAQRLISRIGGGGRFQGQDNLGRTHLRKEKRSGVGQTLELRKDGDLKKECQEVKREEGGTG